HRRKPFLLAGAKLKRCPISPDITSDRIEPDDRQIVADIFPRGGEQILENQRQGQQAWPGIEFEWAVFGTFGMRYCPEIELSAEASVFFRQGDADAPPRQVNGGRKSANAAANHDRGFRHAKGDCMPDVG